MKAVINFTIYTKRRISIIGITFCMLIIGIISYAHYENVRSNTLPIELEITDKYCGLRAAIFVMFKNENRKISVSTKTCESITIGSSHKFYYSKEFSSLRLESAGNRKNVSFILLSLVFFIIAILPIRVKDW